MNRRPQIIMVLCTIANCWLAMQIVHEFGHVVGAWWTGATVEKVVLKPWTLSRTQVSSNLEPLIVAWAGPVIGVLVPAATWVLWKSVGGPGAFALRFFAGFCLIANGAYLGAGALDRVGDAGDIQRQGAPLWPLLVFAAVTIPAGL